eukprot:gnl/TRDRNA2_/TRDRNA2_180883_c0_seq1.p1 gnl/TRDRNA2_/TRDRNA2_180883_c0~~gnl/TRDRNA2_/TRDRNA2_180883_c0_seq1.p1  ORF type:complete len:311 (+),score=91.87 gnl/TRDRNA2_/TRDRNA2_180883_c0_seq1:75-935(+)
MLKVISIFMLMGVLSIQLACSARQQQDSKLALEEVDQGDRMLEFMANTFFTMIDHTHTGALTFGAWSLFFRDKLKKNDELILTLNTAYHDVDKDDSSSLHRKEFVTWFLTPHPDKAPLTKGEVLFESKELQQAFFDQVSKGDGLLDQLFDAEHTTVSFVQFKGFLTKLNKLKGKLGHGGMASAEQLIVWQELWTKEDDAAGKRGFLERDQVKKIQLELELQEVDQDDEDEDYEVPAGEAPKMSVAEKIKMHKAHAEEAASSKTSAASSTGSAMSVKDRMRAFQGQQ